MKAVVGNLDFETKQELFEVILAPSQSGVPGHMWNNSVFLLIFFGLLLIGIILLAIFIYRLVTKWTKYRRRMKRKPRTLLGTAFVLILGVVSSGCLIGIIFRWSAHFKNATQMREALLAHSADSSYFAAYSAAMSCSTSVAKETSLSMFKKQYGSLGAALDNYTEVLEVLQLSRNYLDRLVNLVEKCKVKGSGDLQELDSAEEEA
ncbi:unnamed protein product [Strongylus vulgaris]|uniref:Uncharacterized protein n=1 Tax=Strongylus vulgaris TaxID=40348 RepID=A0A3P7IPR5_STRVU|nr:unnamed protein product [Strongylus vulgaris]